MLGNYIEFDGSREKKKTLFQNVIKQAPISSLFYVMQDGKYLF